jgi:phage FluMu protein Com
MLKYIINFSTLLAISCGDCIARTYTSTSFKNNAPRISKINKIKISTEMQEKLKAKKEPNNPESRTKIK